MKTQKAGNLYSHQDLQLNVSSLTTALHAYFIPGNTKDACKNKTVEVE